MTAPLDVSGQAMEAQPEAVLEGAGGKAIEGRSLGRIAWIRLKRDKAAIIGAFIVVFLTLVAIFAERPFGGLIALFGDNPNIPNNDLIDPLTSAPSGAWGGISLEHPFGLEPVNGRDLFARVLSGAQISLLVAFLATLMSVVIGSLMGVLAGFFGGWVDTLISRLMDIFLAFPLLLFAIAIVGALPDSALGLTGNGLRIAVIVFIIGFFSWPYIARIVRGQTLSLREREFVDAARSLGAGNGYIIFREMLPNLVAPILVYATLLIPTNILFEAALSFLGVGVNEPQASWGGMLTRAVDYYQIAPHFMIVPGLAIFITVMAFNLLGDGLRDALDPRAR
ncbi:ABC transporter permease [Streptosporangium sp. NPDC001559]|uniref:ABC transporter permease n=1 Tax=Streptosporangium sp. NPDC001559 TaxID=3366187 RepID=UPI0036E97E9A